MKLMDYKWKTSLAKVWKPDAQSTVKRINQTVGQYSGTSSGQRWKENSYMKTTHRPMPLQGDRLGALGRICRTATQAFAGIMHRISSQDDKIDSATLKDLFGRAYLADAGLYRRLPNCNPDNSGTHFSW